jgi:protein O-GlcNAc transferase
VHAPGYLAHAPVGGGLIVPAPTTTLQQIQALVAAGKLDEAWVALGSLLRREPNSHTLQLFAAQLAAAAREHERALTHARAALALSPADPATLKLIASQLSALKRHDEAAQTLATVLEAAPRDAAAACARATELLRADRMDEAEESLVGTVQSCPSHIPAWRELAQLLLATGRATEAASVLERASIAHPRDTNTAAFLASTLNYAPGADPARIADAHRRAARLMEQPGLAPTHSNTPDPDRPIVIGYISPDLHAHSISHFLLPLVEHHDRTSFVPHFFWTGRVEDGFTERYRRAGVWHPCRTLSNEGICSLVRRSGIDVLVELSGYTSFNALPAIAYRPAPVQISAIGYPNSTGLAAIDARLGDSTTDPVELRPGERLLRVDPCFLCYEPPRSGSGEEPEPLIDDASRPPTFGSFNALQKYHTGVIDLWSHLLSEVPGSRLVLKGDLRLSGVGKRLVHGFESRAVDRSRITLLGQTPTPAEGRLLYGKMDVALDTFPYNGTTTTCEALWMGVPVVTMLGTTHAARVSASLIRAAGLGELVADSTEAYVRIARELVLDRPRVTELRRTLRARLLASTLCDAEGYTRRFESAVRALWRGWCTRPR